MLETTAGRIARQLLAAALNKRVAAVIFRDTLLVTTNQIVTVQRYGPPPLAPLTILSGLVTRQ